jgi:RsiW-degrading membrane proteinase PrsW (M82 family)
MNTIGAVILSILLGFLPMLLFAFIVYWVDRYEKEPRILLGGVFLWGASLAAGAAILVNTVMGLGIYIFTRSDTITEMTTGSLIAPIVEESLKGFAVLIVFVAFRHEFDSILDGIIYASVTALGFAATENAYYIYNFGYVDNGLIGILIMFVIRVILVGWQHPFYTAFTGIGLATARLSHKPSVKVIAPLAGLSIAILTHAFHNTMGSFLPGLAGLATGTLIDWSGWFIMFIFILWALRREQRWIIRNLKEEVELALISPAQYRVACSAWMQTLSRLKALSSGRYRATNRFYQLAAELAYKKEQHLFMGDEGGNGAMIENLRTELTRLAGSAVS